MDTQSVSTAARARPAMKVRVALALPLPVPVGCVLFVSAVRVRTSFLCRHTCAVGVAPLADAEGYT